MNDGRKIQALHICIVYVYAYVERGREGETEKEDGPYHRVPVRILCWLKRSPTPYKGRTVLGPNLSIEQCSFLFLSFLLLFFSSLYFPFFFFFSFLSLA